MFLKAEAKLSWAGSSICSISFIYLPFPSAVHVIVLTGNEWLAYPTDLFTILEPLDPPISELFCNRETLINGE